MSAAVFRIVVPATSLRIPHFHAQVVATTRNFPMAITSYLTRTSSSLKYASFPATSLPYLMQSTTDGPTRIYSFQPSHHPPPNRHGRSPPQIPSSLQSPQSPSQDRREEDMGFLQRISLVSTPSLSTTPYNPSHSVKLPSFVKNKRPQTTETIEVTSPLNPNHNPHLHPSTPGIRKATAWYNSHISINNPPIRGMPQPVLPTAVLLTDDVANRQKSTTDGIPCTSGNSHCNPNPFDLGFILIYIYTVRKYVEGLPSANELLDLISATGGDIEPTKAVAARQALYPEVAIPIFPLSHLVPLKIVFG